MVYATTGHNGQSDLSAGHVLRQAHESPQGKVKESTPRGGVALLFNVRPAWVLARR